MYCLLQSNCSSSILKSTSNDVVGMKVKAFANHEWQNQPISRFSHTHFFHFFNLNPLTYKWDGYLNQNFLNITHELVRILEPKVGNLSSRRLAVPLCNLIISFLLQTFGASFLAFFNLPFKSVVLNPLELVAHLIGNLV